MSVMSRPSCRMLLTIQSSLRFTRIRAGPNTPFSAHDRHYVFSRQPPPASVPAGVEFVSQSIAAFAERLRDQPGKNIWMMGGGELIASFLDEKAIDEFIITVVPIFIGEGIPLIAPRHLEVPLKLRSVKPFPDGVVQVHYDLRTNLGLPAKGDARLGRRRPERQRVAPR